MRTARTVSLAIAVAIAVVFIVVGIARQGNDQEELHKIQVEQSTRMERATNDFMDAFMEESRR